VLEGSLIARRYRIERLIGRGGMSQVFEATDTKFGAAVALKLASPPDEDFEEFLARFRREAKIGRLLGRRSSRFVRALDCHTMVMHQGRVIAAGPFAAIEADETVRDVYLGRQ